VPPKLLCSPTVLSANLRRFNAANLILSYLVSRFSSNGMRHGRSRYQNDRNDFDVKGTSCNVSTFKNPILVGCSVQGRNQDFAKEEGGLENRKIL